MEEKKRVAAYARVSTSSKSQEHSFDNQSRYWNETLGKDIRYEYAGLYADQGISGKHAERRPQFQSLISDCKNGNIDTVYTKSVQRFGRNTTETLECVRELRELGIAVIFEKENINTLDPSSELYLTVAAAIAEDDLIRYSQNIEWTIRERLKKGQPVISSRLYGYLVKANYKLEVNPYEAKVVRDIYDKYVKDKWSSPKIAKYLNEKRIPSAMGKLWHDGQVREMLKNEKYIGACMMQKTYTKDGETRRNYGEKARYHIENNHEAIIDKELWEKAQEIIGQRTNAKLLGRKNKTYPFSKMIECGVCEGKYTHKVNNSGTKWQANFWNCARSLKFGAKTCGNHGINDKVLKEKFIEAYNEFVINRYSGIDCNEVKDKLNTMYEEELELRALSASGLISKVDYEIEQESILKEIRELEKINKALSMRKVK